jgi:tetratricopeptide (TPR) repeat protein
MNMTKRTFLLLCALISLATLSASTCLADAKSEGKAFYKQGQYARALEKLRQAAHDSPSDATVYWQLGFTYRKLLRYEEALQAFQQAGKLDPTHSFASSTAKYNEMLASTRSKIKPRSGGSALPHAVPQNSAVGKLPEVIALKNGSVYVDDARRRSVDSDRLQAVALELKPRSIVKFAIIAKDMRGNQLARYAGTIHHALGLGRGYLFVVSRGGVVAASEAVTPDQLRTETNRVAGAIRKGDVTGGLEKLARALVK